MHGENQPDWPPKPKSAKEEVAARRAMVKEQLTKPYDRREPIKDKRVIQAMLAVPRHAFVPKEIRAAAYDDRALPIGEGQTISQPYIVAIMTELMAIDHNSKVLEVGTGSGYQAAVLAHITPHVYSIEIVEELYHSAKQTLQREGYLSVKLKLGDGYLGWPEHAPFDAITVTCAEDEIPQPLWKQLKAGGRMVIPLGEKHGSQELVVITKAKDGSPQERSVIPVRFVPMTHRQVIH